MSVYELRDSGRRNRTILTAGLGVLFGALLFYELGAEHLARYSDCEQLTDTTIRAINGNKNPLIRAGAFVRDNPEKLSSPQGKALAKQYDTRRYEAIAVAEIDGICKW